MSESKEKKVIEIHANEALPTLFVDNLAVTKRGDDMYFIRFTTALPEGFKEQSRMMIPKDSLVAMLDVLCKQCDYFPTKPQAKSNKNIERVSD
jgi:hypothetical protein